MQTDQDATDYTDGGDPLKMRNTTGTKRNGWNIAADTVYTLNPTTTLTVRGSYYKAEDKRDYPEMDIGEAGLRAASGRTAGGSPYMEGRPLLYFPNFSWTAEPRHVRRAELLVPAAPGLQLHARLSKYFAKHSLKVGMEMRCKRGEAARFHYARTQLRRPTRPPTRWRARARRPATRGRASCSARMDTAQLERVSYAPLQNANTEMYARLRPGRLQGQPEAHPEPRPALRVRGRLLGSGEPAAAAARPDRPDPGHAGGDRPDDPAPERQDTTWRSRPGQKTYIYNGAFYFTERGQQAQDEAWTSSSCRVSAWPSVSTTRPPARRLRPLLHPDHARQLRARTARRDRPGGVQPDHARAARASTASPGVPLQPVPAGPDAGLRQEPTAATRTSATPSLPSTNGARRSATASTCRCSGAAGPDRRRRRPTS